jgi:Xaa-Pro aminopeptidase
MAGADAVSVDPAPLRAARLARLRAAMTAAGHDALLLTSAGAVRYATGAVPIHGDASVEAARPFAAVVTRNALHVLGVEPAFVPPDASAAPWPRDPRAAATAIVERLGGVRRIGVERLPFALGAALARALPGVAIDGAEASLVPARLVKTDDELARLAEAQRRNEAAIAAVLPAIRPGVREVDLTGAFLAAMADEAVTACHVEPIWCVVPRTRADAPWTFAGGLPYRELPSTRVLAPGDQVMIDTGMLHDGYMSDFGCTWTCADAPSAADRTLRARWQAIVDAVVAACRPGATAAGLHRAALAANGQGRPAPWPRPLYLAHGVGLGGVEPPFIGTDAGIDAEERIVLAEGMVLVLEPYAWEDGLGGYRAEQTIAITATGCRPLSAPPP